MISTEEQQFLQYWESHREIESTFLSKLGRGLPMAIMFGSPILLFILVVRIFFPDWYLKISIISQGMLITVIIAVIGLIVFYAYFRMQYKWELNEQLYQELKAKEKNQTSNNKSQL